MIKVQRSEDFSRTPSMVFEPPHHSIDATAVEKQRPCGQGVAGVDEVLKGGTVSNEAGSVSSLLHAFFQFLSCRRRSDMRHYAGL